MLPVREDGEVEVCYYRTQVVAGTRFTIVFSHEGNTASKIPSALSCQASGNVPLQTLATTGRTFEVIIFRPLPYTNSPPSVQTIKLVEAA